MKKNVKLTGLALTLMLLSSCGSSSFQKKQAEKLNTSALSDPSWVTMIKDTWYTVEEGRFYGRGQRFDSQDMYSRALRVGETRKER